MSSVSSTKLACHVLCENVVVIFILQCWLPGHHDSLDTPCWCWGDPANGEASFISPFAGLGVQLGCLKSPTSKVHVFIMPSSAGKWPYMCEVPWAWWPLWSQSRGQSHFPISCCLNRCYVSKLYSCAGSGLGYWGPLAEDRCGSMAGLGCPHADWKGQCHFSEDTEGGAYSSRQRFWTQSPPCDCGLWTGSPNNSSHALPNSYHSLWDNTNQQFWGIVHKAEVCKKAFGKIDCGAVRGRPLRVDFFHVVGNDSTLASFYDRVSECPIASKHI